jgi:hypothetical protein
MSPLPHQFRKKGDNMQWFQDLLGWFAILFLAGSILAAAAVLIFSTLAALFMKNPKLQSPSATQPARATSSDAGDRLDK